MRRNFYFKAAVVISASQIGRSRFWADEETELKGIVDLLEAYETKRWPLGRDPSVPGGKG